MKIFKKKDQTSRLLIGELTLSLEEYDDSLIGQWYGTVRNGVRLNGCVELDDICIIGHFEGNIASVTFDNTYSGKGIGEATLTYRPENDTLLW